MIMEEIILLIIILVLFAIFAKGLFTVFIEHFWLAALMLICFFPLLFLWALLRGIFK